jgi:hypothetical protein
MPVPNRARISRRPLPRPAPPQRKGMATARRLSVFQRRIEVGLSPTTLDLLFEHVRVVSEGGLDGDHYAGSTMIILDLVALASRLSDDPDAATARRFAELAPEDARVRHRARALAFAEARRLAGGNLIQPEIDLEVRVRGPVVQLALNVEATLRRSSP